MKVTVGVSNRHIHITKQHFEILFGIGCKLEKLKDLKQPNQFMSTSKVAIKTDKDIIENVRVIGDFRDYTQVEISMTDAYKLGLDLPIRESGDIKDSGKIKICGTVGEIEIEDGCIIASRHIHISPRQMELYGFKQGETVNVMVHGKKGGILSNVGLKVSDDAYFELHLDTDDANAFLIHNNDILDIIGGNSDIKSM